MNIESPRHLFVTELRRAYATEEQLADELSTLVEDTQVDALDGTGQRELSDALEEVLSDHLEATKRHRERLEGSFDALGETVETRSTPALDGVVEEKERFNNVVLADELRPLFYLGTAREIAYVELTGYDRLLGLVDHLDVPGEVVEALEQNRDEERKTLERLETLAGGEEADALLDAVTG